MSLNLNESDSDYHLMNSGSKIKTFLKYNSFSFIVIIGLIIGLIVSSKKEGPYINNNGQIGVMTQEINDLSSPFFSFNNGLLTLSDPVNKVSITINLNNYGTPGPIGPIGEIGPIGLTGPQGFYGPQGLIGPTGATGPIGPTGFISYINDTAMMIDVTKSSICCGLNCTKCVIGQQCVLGGCFWPSSCNLSPGGYCFTTTQSNYVWSNCNNACSILADSSNQRRYSFAPTLSNVDDGFVTANYNFRKWINIFWNGTVYLYNGVPTNYQNYYGGISTTTPYVFATGGTGGWEGGSASDVYTCLCNYKA
jgi:hypothetical protein